MRTALQRFLANIRIEENGCWIWTAGKGTDGYSYFYDGKFWSGHRWSYSHYVGEIGEGLTLDHLCRVRACVNPDHLEPVTHLENVKRGYIARNQPSAEDGVLRCKHGHPFGENITFYRNSKVCKVCNSLAGKRFRERKNQLKTI